MQILKKMLKQKAVYWAPGERDEFGNVKPLECVEIKCRWEDKNELYTDPKTGTTKVSSAMVNTDRDVEIEGWLWLGTLPELTSQVVPEKNSGAYQIKKFDKVPTLSAKQFLRTAIL